MRDFGKVPTQLWNWKGLSFASKSLYAYLASSPNANYFGCYLCKDGYIIADTGMTRASLRRGFEELEAAQLAERIGDFVYVTGVLAQEKPRGDKVTGSRMQEWRELGDDQARKKVAQGMLACYEHLTDEQKAELLGFINTDINTGINIDTNAPLNTDTDTDIKRTESREKRVESKEDSLRSSSCAESAPPLASPPVAVSPEQELQLGSESELQPESKPTSEPPSKPRPKPPKPPPQRNLLLDAVVASTGGDIHATTPNAWAAAATALRQIRAATPEVTPELIAEKARIFRACHDFTLTPTSLCKWWGTLTAQAEAQAKAKAAPADRATLPRRFGFAD